MDWKVYIICCSDDSLYTGITNDMDRRWTQHQNKTGAKYFRGRAPTKIVYIENGHDRRSASQREARIKKLSRMEKLALISSKNTASNLNHPISAVDKV